LKLQYDEYNETLSNFAFNFNLRRYIEAQSQTYPRAAAYARLVNKLLAAARVGPAAAAGRAAAPRFRCVRDQVFGNLRRRAHRSQDERWAMARDVVGHFRRSWRSSATPMPPTMRWRGRRRWRRRSTRRTRAAAGCSPRGYRRPLRRRRGR